MSVDKEYKIMEVGDLFVMAMSRYKRQKYDECATLCTEFLQHNARDQAAWLLKCRTLTQKSWVDDLEIEEEGVADLLMGLLANNEQ
jgi:tetratricopeptide repeat protein 8